MTTFPSKNPINTVFQYTTLNDIVYNVHVSIFDKGVYQKVIIIIENELTYVHRIFQDFGYIRDKNGNLNMDYLDFVVSRYVDDSYYH